jgi:adenylate cyclase
VSDIFISYSRKDSSDALSLAEKLRASGMEVWIDQHGIEAATSWSKEIVQAIKECKAFCLLLSRTSLESNNVVKETSLASEFKRSIVPIELHTIELTDDFHYQLAGLQRVALSDFDAILRSLRKLGISGSDSSGTDSPVGQTFSPLVQPLDSRKSLIVLPFEDLSPTGEDNAWFADGLAGEMIDSLGHIKSLRILDRKTSISLRNTKLRTVEIGKEFNTRYFIEGSVRKFGEQIKISVALLDIETGDYLWQESHRGEFKDIFDIQEAVAEKVVAGLKLHLTKEEKSLLEERGTENAEAYELFIKAGEYYLRQTKESFYLTVQLCTEAIKLDPEYANAYATKANALAQLYRSYDRDPILLQDGLQLAKRAFQLKPDLWRAYTPLSVIYTLQGKLKEAEQLIKKYIQNAPDDYRSHITLGFFYMETEQYTQAIISYENAVKLNPDSLTALWNLVRSCYATNNSEKRIYWASVAISKFERHLKLHPQDENMLVSHACLLNFADRPKEALEAVKVLDTLKDGLAIYNTACLQSDLGDKKLALRSFRKAINAGFQNIQFIMEFLSENVTVLSGTPEYEEVKQIVEKIEAEQLAATNMKTAKDNV